jgi:hypothetical protein
MCIEQVVWGCGHLNGSSREGSFGRQARSIFSQDHLDHDGLRFGLGVLDFVADRMRLRRSVNRSIVPTGLGGHVVYLWGFAGMLFQHVCGTSDPVRAV